MPNVAHHLYSSFEESEDPVVTILSAPGFCGTDAANGYHGTKSHKITADPTFPTGIARSYFGKTITDYNISIPPRRKWLVSWYATADVAGMVSRLIVKRSDGVYFTAGNVTVVTPMVWVRGSYGLDWSGSNETALMLATSVYSASGSLWYDAIMLEEVAALPATPSAYAAPAHPYSLVAQCGDMLVSESGTGRFLTDGLAIREELLPVAIKNLDGTYDYVDIRNL